MEPSAAVATLDADLLGKVTVDAEKVKQEDGIGQESMAQWGHSLTI